MADTSILRSARTHLVNPIVNAVLRSRAHRLLSGNLLLLEYTGRRTGYRFGLPVAYAPESPSADLIVMAGQHETKTWWRNFDVQPQQVTVHLRGRAVQARARLLTVGTEEYARAVCAYKTRLPRAEVDLVAPMVVLTPN